MKTVRTRKSEKESGPAAKGPAHVPGGETPRAGREVEVAAPAAGRGPALVRATAEPPALSSKSGGGDSV